MQNPTFDHYTIKVSDLEKSCDFYKNVLGLQEITNRTEKPHIRWFSLGDGELHVVEGPANLISTNIGVHMAVRIQDFEEFMSHLKNLGITPHNSKAEANQHTVRADGVNQVYFQDPDGYWIEVNDAS